jgi:pyridoxamine 5'-phosphate oxidase
MEVRTSIGQQHTVIGKIPYTLPEIEKEIWKSLVQGAERGRDGFHTFVIGNQTDDGVDQRTVVLRGVEPGENIIFCHSDARSPKVQDLKKYPKVSLLFYDAMRKFQLRIQAIARVHESDFLADKHWMRTRLSSRKCYLTTLPPGVFVETPGDNIPDVFQGRDPYLEESEQGKAYFALISFQITRIDWLYLSSQGHRRALFQYDEIGGFEANWINP